MKKSISLLHKVKLLLKRIGAPIYINKYGPKQYTLAEKLYSLFLRSEWKSSFRRTVKLSKDIGITTQSKSTLHYTLHKIHWTFIKHMLKATVLRHAYLVAIDGSSLGRNFPSWHYILRAGINILERKPVKLSIAIDTRTKKILSARVRSKMAHDIKDVRYLMKRVDVQTTLLGDTAYDAEWLHEYCFDNNIQTQIKPRKNVRKGFYRRKQMKNYLEEEYHQRSLIEAGQGAVKRKYGGYTLAKKIEAIRLEAYCKAICFNLRLGEERFSTELF